MKQKCMKQKCEICGKPAMSNRCFLHKQKKPLQTNTGLRRHPKEKQVEDIQKRDAFFLGLWKKRVHVCENCGERLGDQPFSYFFDHTLEKSKYPELKEEEENIMLLCFECHDKKTRGFITEIIRKRIEYLKEKYHIFV